jgi:adenylate cyclase
MGTEIERKYLIANDTWKRHPLIMKIEIEQGYLLNTKDKTVRIRVTDQEAWIAVKATIKGKKGLARKEYEYPIPHAEGTELLTMCPDIVSKTRHVLRDDKNQVWEVDIFKKHLRGLKMVELEMLDEKQLVHLHSWVGTEVTSDYRYTNAYLSEHMAPTD